tara:strand:- start:26598 stop:26876 length:279 start_codon:yes stop_codon:yes gene_type:complete
LGVYLCSDLLSEIDRVHGDVLDLLERSRKIGQHDHVELVEARKRIAYLEGKDAAKNPPTLPRPANAGGDVTHDRITHEQVEDARQSIEALET